MRQLVGNALTSLRPAIRDITAEIFWRAGITSPVTRSANHLTVVTFHRVLTDAQLAEYPIPEIAVTCDEFDWFTDFIQAHFDAGPLLQMLDRYNNGVDSDRPLLALTFDDGQRDNYENALPILEAKGLKATFYVTESGTKTGGALWHDEVAFIMRALGKSRPDKADRLAGELGLSGVEPAALPGHCAERLKTKTTEERSAFIDRAKDYLGGDGRPAWDGMMNADQLRHLAASGHEIGSHTRSHAILVNCDQQELEREIGGSRLYLESELGVPVDSFCYPNGDLDSRVVRVVEQSGYRAAVTTAWGRNTRDTDLMQLRRCDIQSDTSRSRRGELSPARLGLRLSGLQRSL